MQQALPFKTWLPIHRESGANSLTLNRSSSLINDLEKMVKEKAVMVFAKKGCCMSFVIKRLLQGQGINPSVHEVEEKDENDVINELEKIVSVSGDWKEGCVQFPVVFIGGKLFGGLDRLIATHINGELIPLLKQAGALWL